VWHPFKLLPTLPLVEVSSYLVDHRGAVPVSPECLRGFVGVLLAGALRERSTAMLYLNIKVQSRVMFAS
jgi:hypothetical protein